MDFAILNFKKKAEFQRVFSFNTLHSLYWSGSWYPLLLIWQDIIKRSGMLSYASLLHIDK